jgi:hypothetical protein
MSLKICLKNLGILKQAEFSLGDLTKWFGKRWRMKVGRHKATPVLLMTNVTTPRAKATLLTQTNYLRELEKGHRQPTSQAANTFNTAHNSLESTIFYPVNPLILKILIQAIIK